MLLEFTETSCPEVLKGTVAHSVTLSLDSSNYVTFLLTYVHLTQGGSDECSRVGNKVFVRLIRKGQCDPWGAHSPAWQKPNKNVCPCFAVGTDTLSPIKKYQFTLRFNDCILKTKRKWLCIIFTNHKTTHARLHFCFHICGQSV